MLKISAKNNNKTKRVLSKVDPNMKMNKAFSYYYNRYDNKNVIIIRFPLNI